MKLDCRVREAWDNQDPKETRGLRGYQVYQVCRERMEPRDQRVTSGYRDPGDLTAPPVKVHLERREAGGTGGPGARRGPSVLLGQWEQRGNQELLGHRGHLDHQGGVYLVPRENRVHEVHRELWESRVGV